MMNATATDQIRTDAGNTSRTDWSEHWSPDKQLTLVQRFFSLYRKVIFAPAVAYFFDRFFPAEGVFVEAGSGTSETSIKIDKRGGKRHLVAADIVLPVLEHCHPHMDGRVCGDIFRLPFADNSVDGIWNVGVMEHFTQEQIDAIMAEFYRVLKPDHRVVLLIPGADSPPQRMLRVLEKLINARRQTEEFRFHPPEISQIKSKAQAMDLLGRNGFTPVHYNYGWRSLLAFRILVGSKRV